MGSAVDTTEPRERRGLSRRDMIKGAAVAGAAAWTAPVIIDSLSSPAAAESFTCKSNGNWYVVLHSPTSGGGLVDRPGGTWNSSYSFSSYYGGGTCNVSSPGATCAPTSGYTYTSVNDPGIGLSTSSINISHNVTSQNQGSVTLALNQTTSCCIISRVVAQVHRYGAPTGTSPGTDCPTDYCQEATSGGTYLPATGLNSKTVTLNPARGGSLCNNEGNHWGSPNDQTACNSQPGGNGYTNGQPAGYLLIELQCGPAHKPGT